MKSFLLLLTNSCATNITLTMFLVYGMDRMRRWRISWIKYVSSTILEIGGSSLHYLDLHLQLTPSSNDLRIEFDIHRKITYCGTSIHNLSLHPHRHKAAVVNYYIHRMLHLPLSKTNINKEIRHIEKISLINGLDLDIKAMVRRKKLRLLLAPVLLLLNIAPTQPLNVKNGSVYHSWAFLPTFSERS